MRERAQRCSKFQTVQGEAYCTAALPAMQQKKTRLTYRINIMAALSTLGTTGIAITATSVHSTALSSKRLRLANASLARASIRYVMNSGVT